MSGALGLVLVATLADSAMGGPLDPPGPVASTYLTVGELQPAWNRALSSTDGDDTCHSSRFTCVLEDAAVLDHETGLVWARDPLLMPKGHWYISLNYCFALTLGGRSGWRTPTLEELTSLFDATNASPNPSLPDGFPLTNDVDADGYWASTTNPGEATAAYAVDFIVTSPGSFPAGLVSPAKSQDGLYRAWCVRGGQDDVQ